MPPDISFIVPVRNDHARLAIALASIRKNSGHSTEILVADNGSTDSSVAVARAAGAIVLELPGLRVSAMRNRAARAARGKVLAFVDADNEIVAGWTAAAIERLSAENIGAVGQTYDPPAGGTWVQHTYGILRGGSPADHEVDWLGSGNLAIKRDLFLELNGFDESLTTCEDVDLCNRIRQRGYRIVSDRRLGSVHYGDPDSLMAVFRGEVWRGRDNLRVSLRPPLAPRAVTSLALSCLVLLGLVIATIAPFTRIPTELAALGLTLVVGIIALRAGRMALSASGPGARVRRIWQISAVAAAYELGRALALVVRLPHRRPHNARAAAAHV